MSKVTAVVLTLVLSTIVPMFLTVKQAITKTYKSKNSYPIFDLAIDSLIIEYFLYILIGLYFNAILPEFYYESLWAIVA